MLASTILFVFFAYFANGQLSCPEKFEQYMSCLNNLKQGSEFKQIFNRKLEIAQTCGATARNVQCWRSMTDCETQARSQTDATPLADEVLKASVRCYQDNPNDPLAGLESLFHGCGKGGKGKKGGKPGPPPPPPPPRGNNTQGQGQRPTGGIQGVGEWRRGQDNNNAGNDRRPSPRDDSGSSESHEGGGKEKKMPEDCMPNDMKSLMNCSIQAMQKDQNIISSAQSLRPQVKKCEDLLTSDCEPETKPLKMCLKNAMKPYFDVFKTNLKSCMTTAGFPMANQEKPSFL